MAKQHRWTLAGRQQTHQTDDPLLAKQHSWTLAWRVQAHPIAAPVLASAWRQPDQKTAHQPRDPVLSWWKDQGPRHGDSQTSRQTQSWLGVSRREYCFICGLLWTLAWRQHDGIKASYFLGVCCPLACARELFLGLVEAFVGPRQGQQTTGTSLGLVEA